MDSPVSIRSFDHLGGDLFHDFSAAVFRILPVISNRIQQQLIEEVIAGRLEKEPLGVRKHIV